MFYISGMITSATVKRLVRYLHSEATNTALYVYISSPGGCTRSALAIYEILRTFSDKTQAPVITQALDECYSAALIIYLAGDKRCTTEHATFMIHEVQVEEGRDKRAKGYKETATELEKETTIIFNLIKKRTKLQLGTIRRKIKKAVNGDWLFESKEALKWSIANEKGFYLPEPAPQIDEEVSDEDEDEEIDEDVIIENEEELEELIEEDGEDEED